MTRWTMSDVTAHKRRHQLANEPVVTAVAAAAAPTKYHNKTVVIDGITFDSKKEGQHYLHLKMRLRLGEISDLELQPVFEIYIINDKGVRKHCGDYTADFRYWEKYCGKDTLRVDDVKSPASRTEVYQLRKTIIEALYDITITEV